MLSEILNPRQLWNTRKALKVGIYKSFDKRIWQRNYYEHIIRNEKEYYRIKEYIQNNVVNWKEDKYFEY